jgi:hypothetical protein
MGVKFEIPTESLEPLFNALNLIKPHMVTSLERQALGILKQAIYFELEVMLETPEEREEREVNFKKLFNEQRRKIEIERQVKEELEKRKRDREEHTQEEIEKMKQDRKEKEREEIERKIPQNSDLDLKELFKQKLGRSKINRNVQTPTK